MNLSEKQSYFCYGTDNWSYKEPPVLSDDITREMKRARLDKDYRIIWGGVAIYRTEPDQLTGEVKGDRRATRVNGDSKRLQPSYLFGRARQPVRDWYVYVDDLNQRVKTTRQEFVPPGRTFIIEVEYVYVEYGLLNWFVEYHHQGDWYSIKRLETPDGLYYEPDMRTVDFLKEREHENRNENLNDVARREREIMAKIKGEQSRTEDRKKRQMINAMMKDQFRRAEKQTAYPILM